MPDNVQIEKVKQILRNIKAPVSRNEDGDFDIAYGDMNLCLKSSDLQHYLDIKDSLARSVAPSICIPGCFEQAVEVQGLRQGMWHPMVRNLRGGDEKKLEDANGRAVLLSPASITFVLAQLDCNELPKELRRKIRLGGRRGMRKTDDENGDAAPFDVLFSNILTIKVHTDEGDALAKNCDKLQAVAEAALFHFAYGHGIGFALSETWGRVTYRRVGHRQNRKVQFPRRTYISELLAYYHLALGCDSPILAYLALYKILEYFFTSSSERVVHQELAEKLVEPDFSHMKSDKLNELVGIVRHHDKKLNERRLLRTVIEDHIDEEHLRGWIKDYDEENDDYYTTERDLFADNLKIDTSDNQIYATTANRIYHIRNALVHHKEGEMSRFIPFSGQEEVLHEEIPLLLYLAEQVIIKNGEDIDT